MLSSNRYTPSYALALFGIAIFAASFIVHAFQVYRYKTCYFITVPVTLIAEIKGYVFRSLSAHNDPYKVEHYVLQYFLSSKRLVCCLPAYT